MVVVQAMAQSILARATLARRLEILNKQRALEAVCKRLQKSWRLQNARAEWRRLYLACVRITVVVVVVGGGGAVVR